MEHFENRDALVDFIIKRGGKAVASVSKKTSYLINNDTASSSSKNKKAQELGIPILSEEEFLRLVEDEI
ncbi:MAG: BRCT domain-containing protein [Clostridia bacterium]